MTTKTDIKRLLSKGLTGREAGKLALQDFWEQDHFREGFLSDRDLSAIKASLRTSQDINDYNSYMETYKILDYTLKDAHIIALELQKRISALSRLAMMYLLDATSVFELLSRPTIMTNKQYEDYKEEARQERLKSLSFLEEILESRLDRIIDSLDNFTEEDFHTEEDLLVFVRREYPDLWKQTVSEILDLIKQGKLKAVYFIGKDKEDLDILWNKSEDLRSELPINKLSKEEKIDTLLNNELRTNEINKKLQKAIKEEDAYLESLYKRGNSKKSEAELIKSLEKLLEGSLNEEEELSLFSYTFSSYEDLYKAGLPEWISFVDSPITKDLEYRDIAIVVDPASDKLDGRGYYKSIYRSYNELITQERALDVIDTFTGGIKQSKEEIKVLLAFQAIIETLSEVIGIDFTEDMKDWIKDIESEIKEYNNLKLKIDYEDQIPEEIKEALPYLDLNKFKPSAKTTKYLKDRLSMSLGDNWRNDVKQAFIEDLEAMEAE